MAISKEEALAEAYRRGIMQPQQKSAYEEAVRRGLVASTAAPKEETGVLQDIGHGFYGGISGMIRGAPELVRNLGSIDRFVERGVAGLRGEDVGAIERKQASEIAALRAMGKQASEVYEPENLGFQQPSGLGGTVASAIGGLVPYVASSPIGGLPYVLGASQGGGEAAQRLDKFQAEGGQVSPEEYNIAANKGIGIGLAEGLLPDFLGGGLGKAVSRIGNAKRAAIIEGGSELAGSIAQDLTEQAYNENAQVQLGQAFTGGGVGGVLGAAAGAMVPGRGGSVSATQASPESRSAREQAKGLVNREEQKATRLERLRAAEATATSKSEAKLFKRLADNEEFMGDVDKKVASLEEAKAEFGTDPVSQADIQKEIDKLKARKTKIEEGRKPKAEEKAPLKLPEVSETDPAVALPTGDVDALNASLQRPMEGVPTLPEVEQGTPEPDYQRMPVPEAIEGGDQIEVEDTAQPGPEGLVTGVSEDITLERPQDYQPPTAAGITVGEAKTSKPIEIPPVIDPEVAAQEEAAAKAQAERDALRKQALPKLDKQVDPKLIEDSPGITAEDIAELEKSVEAGKDTSKKGLTNTAKDVQGRASEVQTGKKSDVLAGPQNASAPGRTNLKGEAAAGPNPKPYRGGPVTFDAGDDGWSSVSRGEGAVDAKAVADKIMANWENPPANLIVVDNLDDPRVRQIVRDTWNAQNAKLTADNPGKTLTRQPRAFFDDGKIYIVGGGHANAESVARSVYHEAVGHYGVRGAFGKGVADIYDTFAKLRPDLLNERIKAYGLDANTPAGRQIAAEEVLAKLAETNPKLGVVKKLVARIRTLLRKYVKGDLKLSDAEIIRDYIIPAREFVERGVYPESHGNAQPAFSTEGETSEAKPSTSDRIKSGAETFLKKPFESFADRMERHVNPKVRELGAKVREYVQAKQRNYGAFAAEFNPAVEKYLKLDSEGKKRVAQQYSDYQTAVYNNDKTAADAAIDSADDVTVDLILATRKALDVAAKINEQSGVHVKDAKSGKWRPFKARDNYFPLVMKPRFAAALRNPNNPEYATEFAKLRDWAISKGLAKDTETAREYFAKTYHGGGRLEDFFGNIERSRNAPLPAEAYDFTIDAVRNYQHRWADRAAQIEQFGQNRGDKKEAFSQAMDSLDLDDPMRGYVQTGAQQLYGTTPAGEAIGENAGERVVQLANTAATGLQLGNPGSAITNLGGGSTLTAANFGLKNSSKAWADLVKEGESLKADAIRMGIIRDDFLNLLNDPRGGVEAVNDVLGKTQKVVGKGTQALLKYGGFRAAEDLVRVHAFQTAKHNLIDALDAVRTKPDSMTAKRFEHQAKKEGINVDKLLAEAEDPAGPQTETEKYYRKMVNFVQGSYDLDQIPLWVNSNMGRFFFKYYKFITQATRLFYRGHVEPIIESKDNKVRTDAALRTLRYMAAAGLGGALVGETRETLFDYLFPGDDLSRVKKGLEDKDAQRAVASLADMWLEGMTMSGGLGLIGQGAEVVEAIAQAIDRPEETSRLKNPLQAPGLAPVGAFVELGRRLKDQGQLTAADYHDVAKNAIGMLRTGERLGIKALGLIDDKNYLAKKQTAEFDRRYTASRVKEWMDENNIELPEGSERGGGGTDLFNVFGAGIQRGTQTPKNREIKEALLLGNGKDAERISREFLKGSAAQKDFQKKLGSMVASVRFYDPMYIPGNDKNPDLEDQFRVWAEKNLSKSDYDRILRTTETYRNAAEEAGLWEPVDKREAAARKRKAEREAKRPFNADRLIRKQFGAE